MTNGCNREAGDLLAVRGCHHKDDVGSVEHLASHALGGALHRVAVLGSDAGHHSITGIASLAQRTGRADDDIINSNFTQQLVQHALCECRAAGIACTDK